MNAFSVQLFQRETKVNFYSKSSKQLLNSPTPVTLLVLDKNTAELFQGRLDQAHYIIPPGEQFKIWDTVHALSSWALTEGAGRDVTFIAIGGGVVCDVTAFTASIYMRGVDVILLPTTLLSMVDASVGGKTGIDFEGYKNILGTFYPAREVRVVPEMIQSLPEREYRSGLAEVIKHALLSDEDLFALLRDKSDLIKNRDPELMEEIIYRSLKIKSWFIQKDPLDKNVRGYLNLGHTFGHALESLGNLSQWTHGEAVAWGLNKAMETGVLMGLTDPDYAEEVRTLLEQYDYSLTLQGQDTAELLLNMKRDKKKVSGKVRFILQEKHGKTLYSEVPEEILRKVI